MNKVVLDLQKYEELKSSRFKAEKKAKVLEEQLKELTESGKVAVVTRLRTPFDFLIKKGPEIVEVQGFDSIKDEVTEHFKKGLFDEQISKSLGDRLNQLKEQEREISDLKAEIRKLKSRTLWERITNKF